MIFSIFTPSLLSSKMKLNDLIFKEVFPMKNKQVMNRKTAFSELFLHSCGYEKCLPDQFYGPGVRSYYMIHFILKGQGHYFVADKHYTLQAKQCFLIPPDTMAFYKAEPSDPWTYVWICFHGNAVPAILEHCNFSSDCFVQQLSSVEEYKTVIFDMMQYSQLTPANEYFIQSGLCRIMALLQKQSGAAYNKIESNDNFYILQAIDYIKKSISLDITVADAARHLHISRSYLFELFSQHLNMSPQAFLTSAKIMHARELLAATDTPIASVAADSGYHNPFAFSRAFKKTTGMTPSEYRRKYRRTEELLDC